MLKLTDCQREVLTWIGDGCPPREWPDETHKNTARALASRGLAEVARKKKVWTAEITEAGEYYLEHGHNMPRPDAEMDAASDDDPARSRGRGRPPAAPPTPDATARQMRRVPATKKPPAVKQTKREIKETYMRYKVVVTRVQVAERFIRATSEEVAAEKAQAEFDCPYGNFGSWKTTTSEIDVVEAEQTTVIGPMHLSADGPMLLSLKDAAKSLGISYSTLYQMTVQSDIEWVGIGNRKYIARELLMEFIRANTHRGYYNAR